MASGPYRRRRGGAADDATDRSLGSRLPWLHEGTARPIQRPQDPEEPPEDGRGPKHCHRRHHLLVLHETGHVCFWSHTDDGNASEKSLAELGGDPLPPGRGLDQEKGFPGFVLPGLTIVQPQTTPRGGELTPPEQATHRRRAAISRRIAHARGGVTRDRMGQEHIRLVHEGIRASMRETCGGLPHFR
jgi:hypothetical protein